MITTVMMLVVVGADNGDRLTQLHNSTLPPGLFSIVPRTRDPGYDVSKTNSGSVEETGYESRQTSKMKTAALQFMLEVP